MSLFSKHGKEIESACSLVKSNDSDINWVILSYDGPDSLKVIDGDTGDGGLEELCEELDESKVQYAYTKVTDPNSQLPKYVLVTLCGQSAPQQHISKFIGHVSEVRKYLNVHLHVEERRKDDLEPKLILKRIAGFSGSNYSAQAHLEKPRPQYAVTPVNSVYKKTEVPDIATMQRESMKKEGPPPPVGTRHESVKTDPKKLKHSWGQDQNNADNSAASVRAERERNEKEAREREAQHIRDTTAAQAEKDRATQVRREAEARQQEEEEAVRRQESNRREEEEQRRQDEERRHQEEEKRRQDDERRRQDEEARRQEEQNHRQEEETRRQEEEANRAEENRRQEEEARRLEETHRREEEARHLEETRRQEEAQRQEEESRRQEENIRIQQESKGASDAGHYPTDIRAVVLFAYTAAEDNEINLEEGETVTQIVEVDEGWWEGVNAEGAKGLFPSNYVQKLDPVQESHPAQEPDPVQVTNGRTVVGLYDYDDEISFKRGDEITNVHDVDDKNWLYGTDSAGKKGLFPANFVQEL